MFPTNWGLIRLAVGQFLRFDLGCLKGRGYVLAQLHHNKSGKEKPKAIEK